MKKITIKENKFNKIFKNPINEITYGDIGDAELRSYDLFGFLDSKLGRIIDSLEDASAYYKEYYESLVENLKNGMQTSDGIGYKRQNPYLAKIENLSEQLKESLSSTEDIAHEIENILNKKERQRSNFSDERSKIDYDKFYQDNDDPDITNYIEDNEMDLLRKNYSK